MREIRTSGVTREGVAGPMGPSPLLYRFKFPSHLCSLCHQAFWMEVRLLGAGVVLYSSFISP